MDKNIIEIREFMAEHKAVTKRMASDIETIKNELIPDGKSRLDEVESDVKSLNRYKYMFIGVATFLSTMFFGK